MSMLAWTVYLSFLGVVSLFTLKVNDARAARRVALLTAAAGLLVTLAGAVRYSADGELVTVVDRAWVPQLGIRYQFAVDGISITLLVLTGIAAVAGVLFS